MNLNYLNFSQKPETTKKTIIEILTEQYPLTLQQIRTIISKKYQKSLTYQAIYKELNLLGSKNIILKENKQYLLNKNWILAIHKYSEQIYLNYTNKLKHNIKKILNLKTEGESLILEFESYSDIDHFFIQLLNSYNDFFSPEEPVLMHYRNNWWPILYNKEEFEFMKNLKSKFYTLCIGDSDIDKLSYHFEEKIGLKIRILKEKTPYWMFQLFGPFVINYIPDETIYQKLKTYFLESKIKNLEIDKLLKIINQKGNFKVIFMKNETLKQELLKEINTYFKNN